MVAQKSKRNIARATGFIPVSLFVEAGGIHREQRITARMDSVPMRGERIEYQSPEGHVSYFEVLAEEWFISPPVAGLIVRRTGPQ